MAVVVPKLFAHGAEIPSIGFGTSSKTTEDCGEIVATALKLGYRHVDTSGRSGREKGVGEGIRASGIPRAEIFVVTKVRHENLRAADVARSVDESLKRLQVDYIDLLHLHWPNREVPLPETMMALAKAKRDGYVRHIGVSNFHIALLEEAIRVCPEPLVALQVEYHPYLDQSKLLAFCRGAGLILTAFSPLATGRLFQDPILTEIARAKGRTIAQITLRWLMQQGNIAAIPRSENRQHMAESLDVFNFSLTDEEMQKIYALKRPDGRRSHRTWTVTEP